MMMMVMMMSYHASLNILATIITAVNFLVALTADQVVFFFFQANRDGYER